MRARFKSRVAALSVEIVEEARSRKIRAARCARRASFRNAFTKTCIKFREACRIIFRDANDGGGKILGRCLANGATLVSREFSREGWRLEFLEAYPFRARHTSRANGKFSFHRGEFLNLSITFLNLSEGEKFQRVFSFVFFFSF